MKNKYEIAPFTDAWLEQDDLNVSSYFGELGFHNLKEILDMRVFDLMNMNHLDAIRVEEIITCLYKFFNRDAVVDEALYDGLMSQPFDFRAWFKKHKNASEVIVSDIVMAEDINWDAVQEIYEEVKGRFFNSDEYNWREYRYWNYKDYLKQKKRNGGKK